jgi:Rrf2 family protein
VDLTLSRRGDYALRAAIALAGAGEEFRKGRDISESMAIPRSYTAPILGILVEAGLVEARAGRDGGYRLLRPASEVSVLEVVEAAEGPLVSENCPMRGGPCRWSDVCAVHPTWSRVSEAVRTAMGSSTLADLAREDAGISGRSRGGSGTRRARR